MALVVLLVCCASAGAQQRKYLHFDHISTEQGLSQFTVRCIVQDSAGFMWFATQDGLNRYDGYDFTVYKHSPNDLNSLSGNDILSLVEDSDGLLWVGTVSGGLNRFDPRSETFVRFRHDADVPGSLAADQVSAILEDSRGVLWVGTRNGLDRFDPQTGTFSHFRNDDQSHSNSSKNRVLALCEDSRGALWVGTAAGLELFDRETETFVSFELADRDHASTDVVVALTEDSAGMLWIGTSRCGLVRLDPQTGRSERFRHDPRDATSLADDVVEAVFEDSAGTLWVGTRAGGLHRFDPGSATFEHFQHDDKDPASLSDDWVKSIAEDSGGTLWFGTFGAGVNRFDPHTEAFSQFRRDPEYPSTSLSQDKVLSICTDAGGDLWLGTLSAGLNRYDAASGTFAHFRHDEEDPTSISDDRVNCILQAHGGGLWVGTARGLDHLDPRTGTFSHLVADARDPASLSSDLITHLREDSRGSLWIGTWGDGLHRLDPATGRLEQFLHDDQDPSSLSSAVVEDVLEDTEGTLWVGTWGGGLDRFDRQTRTFTQFRHDEQDPTSISHDRVTCLMQSAAGELWIGTSGGGLDRLVYEDGQVRFERFTTEDGLASDAIGGILEDASGRLWLSTTQGISRFNPKTKQFKNFGGADGVQGSGYWIGSFFEDRRGIMYFGGTLGVTWFRPEEVVDDTQPPRVVLTQFLLFNREVRFGGEGSPLAAPIAYCQEIVLDHTQYLFSLDFAALHYAQPERNQYAYMMEGLDTEWVRTDASNRRATYTKLPAGTYTFQVKASNSDGYWNEEGRSLTIKVLPPPWKTWWAYCVYGVTLLVLAVGLVKVRERSLKQRARELERLVDERTEELRRNLQELETLDQIVVTINRTEGLTQVMEACLEQGLKLLPQAFSGVFLGREPGAETFKVLAVSGWDPEQALGITYDADEAYERYLDGPAAAEGVFVIRDAQTRRGADKVSHLPVSSTLVSLDLTVDDEVLGFLVFDLAADGQGVSPADLQRLGRYRQHAINAVAKAGLVNDLKKADRAKSAFLANMSHELRTPLNSIIGFTDVIIQRVGDGLPPRYRKFLANILGSAQHLLSLINDILDLSKVEAGRMSLELEEVSVPETVESVCRMMKGVLDKRRIRLTQAVPPDMPLIVLDGGKLKQILFNLVSNAVKFSPDDTEVVIAARVLGDELSSGDAGTLVITVRDHGVGIAEADQRRIFDEFTQLEDVVTRSSVGTGLGLALVKRFVEMHGGSVSVESEPGEGSTFTVRLPQAAGPTTPSEPLA